MASRIASLDTCASPLNRSIRVRRRAGKTYSEFPASRDNSLNQSTTLGAKGISIAGPVLLCGMCQRASVMNTFFLKAVNSSEIRTPVASKIFTARRLSDFICAFIRTANSSALSISRFLISGRLPMMASSWIPAHGLAKISFLPVACLKIPRRTHQRVKSSTQPVLTRSICAITSAGPTERIDMAPMPFSIRFRFLP